MLEGLVMDIDSALGETVVASQDAIWCDLKGEVVVLHLSSGVYFGLAGVSLSVWQFIQTPRTLPQVLDHLMSTFEVTPDVCREKTLALIDELSGHGLILRSTYAGPA
jgi:hypothetical protein